jgi:hypothetical protein
MFGAYAIAAFSDWCLPKWNLHVFLSSTFTDTHTERNIILDQLAPSLRKEGIRVGIDVAFSDMRWGMKDENTLDHLTWIGCAKEIDRCREASPDLFFLSLQSEK